MWVLCGLSLFAVFIQGGRADEQVDVVKSESDLRRDLFQNYDKLVRPVKNPATAVPVLASFTPIYLQNLDEQKALIEIDSWLVMKWKDENLLWDPKHYGGIKQLSLPMTEVWKPDLTLYTGVAGTSLPEVPTNVIVNSTSDVFWIPPFAIKSRCPLQGNKGPRKFAQCNLQIGSWTYNGYLLDIQKYADEVDLSNFQDSNPDWQLVSVTSDRESKHYACCVEPYPVLNFNVTLKRRPSAYKTLPSENSALFG